MQTSFSGILALPLEFGHALEIVAKIIENANRFQINLSTEKTEDNPDTNIGLRIKCDFGHNRIARNARIAGKWGDEEETKNNFPGKAAPIAIESGEFFIIYILASEERFHISINSRPFCTFNYRLPLKEMCVLEIYDEIETIRQVDHRTIFPNPWPALHTSDNRKAFSNDIPILFTPGHITAIKAHCFGNSRGRFIVKFHDTDTKREELHFSVRFDEKVMVRNTMNNNLIFGSEERFGNFPFIFEQQFKIAFAFTQRKCLIAVNGFNFCSYFYRTSDALKKLVGFKITCLNGLQMNVRSVDHIHTKDANCAGFEKYSRL